MRLFQREGDQERRVQVKQRFKEISGVQMERAEMEIVRAEEHERREVDRRHHERGARGDAQ